MVRGKLGDSLVLAMAARRYVAQFPEDDVTLAMRADYARLLEGEPGLRLLPFGSRLEMAARLLWLRLTAPAFDVLAVLWGFGSPIRAIARLVRAARKISFDPRAGDLYPESPAPASDFPLVDPAMQVIHCFEPRLGRPDRVELPALAARRARAAHDAVGLAPIADELRKNWDPASLDALLALARRRHPGRALRVFVNPANAGAASVLGMKFPADVELHRFSRLDELVEKYLALEAWYGADTGLYHLAAAMGIPCTVFFGPTQPWKIVMPGQPRAASVRLAVLGRAHCEEKSCARPLCLHQAVASYCGAAPRTALADTPPGCPLRAHPPQALAAIDVHENPGR